MSSTSYSLGELRSLFGGEVIGDDQLRVTRVAPIENASADAITFLANELYLKHLKHTRAGAVIVAPSTRNATPVARIVCPNPYAYFARVSALLNPARKVEPGRHASAFVHAEAHVHEGAEIGPFVSIARGAQVNEGAIIGAGCVIAEDAVIGAGARLYPSVTVYERCSVGQRTIVHAGAVIGADGFGIAFDEDHWVKVPQVGAVRIGDDCEIGANTTIDRGAIEDTVIEEGVKLDNQIQIAHNVRIGAHTAIAACTGIAGSAQIGRYCRIGGGVGIAGHVVIADKVEISGHTAITKSIPAPGMFTGVYPFEPNRDWRRNASQLRHLAELARRVSALEDELEEIKRGRS